MVEVVSVRVEEETRRRMKRFPNVNWSEVVREAIIERLKKEERRREIDVSKLHEAAELTDNIRKKYPCWDSVEEIRTWRERYR